MKIQAQLTFNKFAFNQDSDAHLVLSIAAPGKDNETPRPDICIVPCIDVSGSMDGPKLDYAKRSAIKLIEHLKPGDYCGLIAFDSNVRIVIKPHRLTAEGKDRLKTEIGKLRAGSSTNFSGGLLTALDEIDKLDLPPSVLQRVVMFTDGQANAGVATKGPDIIRLLTNASRTTVSAFGYGSDADQTFLADFAKEGKGNYAYIQDPDGALTAFGKELGGLLSTYATNLVLRLDPLAGHEIVNVVSDVEADQEAIGGNVTIRMQDILGEETRTVVLAVRLKEQKQALPRPVNVFDLKVEYDMIDIQGKKERKTIEAKAKVSFVKAGEEDKNPDEALDTIVALAQVIRSQIEAEEMAKKGQYQQAQQVMVATADRTRRRGRMAAAAAADNLGVRLGDQAAYTSNQGYLRSFQVGGTRGMGGAEYSADAALDLQNLGVALSNSTQASTSTSFTGGAAPFVPVDLGAAPILGFGVPPGVPVVDLFGDHGLVNLMMGNVEATAAADAVKAEPPKTKRIRQARSSRW